MILSKKLTKTYHQSVDISVEQLQNKLSSREQVIGFLTTIVPTLYYANDKLYYFIPSPDLKYAEIEVEMVDDGFKLLFEDGIFTGFEKVTYQPLDANLTAVTYTIDIVASTRRSLSNQRVKRRIRAFKKQIIATDNSWNSNLIKRTITAEQIPKIQVKFGTLLLLVNTVICGLILFYPLSDNNLNHLFFIPNLIILILLMSHLGYRFKKNSRKVLDGIIAKKTPFNY